MALASSVLWSGGGAPVCNAMEDKQKPEVELRGVNTAGVKKSIPTNRDLSNLKSGSELDKYSLDRKEPEAAMTRFLRLEGPVRFRVPCVRKGTTQHAKLCA